MKGKEIKLIGEATAEQIAEWKSKYPLGIYGLKSGDAVGYFQNPSLDHANCATAKADKQAAYDMYKELGELTFIGGCRSVLESPTKFLGIADHLKRKMDGEKAELLDL